MQEINAFITANATLQQLIYAKIVLKSQIA